MTLILVVLGLVLLAVATPVVIYLSSYNRLVALDERCETADPVGRSICWNGRFLVLRHSFLPGENSMRQNAVVG